MGRLEAEGDSVYKPKNKKRIPHLVKLGPFLVAAAALGFVGCDNQEQEISSPSATSSVQDSTPNSEQEDFYQARISDFHVPPEKVTAEEKLNWLEEEVNSRSGDRAYFGNEDYIVSLKGAFIKRPEAPGVPNKMGIRIVNVRNFDDFTTRRDRFVCELEQFFNQPIEAIQKAIKLDWESPRAAEGVNPQALKAELDSHYPWESPACLEEK